MNIALKTMNHTRFWMIPTEHVEKGQENCFNLTTAEKKR